MFRSEIYFKLKGKANTSNKKNIIHDIIVLDASEKQYDTYCSSPHSAACYMERDTSLGAYEYNK